MNALNTLFTCCLITGTVNAQQLERSIVSSTGTSASAGNIRLEYSLGDLVVTSFVSPDLVVTQGFHQTFDFSTTVVEAGGTSLSVYPNPTRDRITVLWTGAGSGEADVFLHDPLGQVLWNSRIWLIGPLEIDLGDRAAGAYFLRVVPDGAPTTVVRLEKVG